MPLQRPTTVLIIGVRSTARAATVLLTLNNLTATAPDVSASRALTLTFDDRTVLAVAMEAAEVTTHDVWWLSPPRPLGGRGLRSFGERGALVEGEIYAPQAERDPGRRLRSAAPPKRVLIARRTRTAGFNDVHCAVGETSDNSSPHPLGLLARAAPEPRRRGRARPQRLASRGVHASVTTHLRTRRTPRRWPILGNVLATLSLLIGAAGAVELLYAFLFSGGNEAIPEGTEQLVVWFALPTLAVAAAALAMRQAIRVADRGGRLLWIAVADGLAVVAIIAWWLYALSLTG